MSYEPGSLMGACYMRRRIHACHEEDAWFTDGCMRARVCGRVWRECVKCVYVFERAGSRPTVSDIGC